MALDPSISLGIKSPTVDIPGSLLTGANLAAAYLKPQQIRQQIAQSQQEIAASQTGQRQTEAATANLQAQQPGLVAASADATRALAAKQYIGLHMKDWTITNPDGNAIIDSSGNPQLNYTKAIADLTASGYGDLAPGLAKQFSDTSQSIIKSAKDVNELNDVVQKSSIQAGGVVAQLVQNSPDPTTAMKQYQAGRQHYVDIYGENSPVVTNMPIAPSQVELQKWALATNQATMSTKDQQELAISKQQLALNTQQVQNQIIQLKMSGADQLRAGQDATQKAGMFMNGSNNVDAWAKIEMPTGAGNWSSALWAKYIEANPSMQPTYQALIAHNAITGDNLTMVSPPAAIKKALAVDAKNYNQQANIFAQSAKLSGMQAPAQTTPQPITGAPAGPTKIPVINTKTGATGKMLASELSQYPEWKPR